MQIKFFSRGWWAAVLLGLTACTSTDAPVIQNTSMSPTPLLGKFVWHDLITDDIDAAREFYAGLFGWTFEETERPGGGPYTLIRSGSRYVAGMVELADPDSETEYSRWLGYLSVADVAVAAEQARAAGGIIERQPRQVGQVGQAAVIQDPQGAVLGLLRITRGDPDDSAAALPGHISWHELLAESASAASDFYVALAQYQAREVQRNGGTVHILGDGLVDRLSILQNPMEEVKPAWLTHFAVTDPVAAARRVDALGGRVLLAPSPELRNGSMALVADPTGAVLVLSQMQQALE